MSATSRVAALIGAAIAGGVLGYMRGVAVGEEDALDSSPAIQEPTPPPEPATEVIATIRPDGNHAYCTSCGLDTDMAPGRTCMTPVAHKDFDPGMTRIMHRPDVRRRSPRHPFSDL